MNSSDQDYFRSVMKFPKFDPWGRGQLQKFHNWASVAPVTKLHCHKLHGNTCNEKTLRGCKLLFCHVPFWATILIRVVKIILTEWWFLVNSRSPKWCTTLKYFFLLLGRWPHPSSPWVKFNIWASVVPVSKIHCLKPHENISNGKKVKGGWGMAVISQAACI